ncbi:unnamed protein product [Calypogeia fissa]
MPTLSRSKTSETNKTQNQISSRFKVEITSSNFALSEFRCDWDLEPPRSTEDDTDAVDASPRNVYSVVGVRSCGIG